MGLADKYWGCHQLPERSFFIKGYQFPVCARCLGIMIGELLAVLIYLADIHIPFILLIVMMIAMCIDGGLQLLTAYKSNNFKRLLTGLIFGIAFMFITIKGVVILYTNLFK